MSSTPASQARCELMVVRFVSNWIFGQRGRVDVQMDITCQLGCVAARLAVFNYRLKGTEGEKGAVVRAVKQY